MKKLISLLTAALLFSLPVWAQSSTGLVTGSGVTIPTTGTLNPTPLGTDLFSEYPSGGTSPLSIQLSTIWSTTSSNLTPTGVTAGSYTNTNLTVGADGRITAIGNGICGGGGGSTTAPTVQSFTSGTGNYTTPAGAVWLRVRMVGAGGGGGGSGTSSGGSTGGTGGNTTFGSSFLTANGGGGGSHSSGFGSPITGGTASGGDINITGGSCGASSNNSAYIFGAPGASTPFGSGGAGGTPSNAGGAAANNTGAGGGASGGVSSSVMAAGCGTAGGYLEKIITSPASTYSYAIGAAGTAGSAGTSGYAGGAGGSGFVVVEEHYNY
jgi:hypothetical protein